MRYKLLNDNTQKTFAVILDNGEEVMESLQSFAKHQKIMAAQFNAIGAFSKVTVGFFDFAIKDYRKLEFNEQMEVLNIAGDISLYKGDIKIHAHAVLGRIDGTAHGGHLIKATVHPTLEIILIESPGYLKREMDDESGIPLIKI